MAYNYRLNENGASVSYGSAPTDYKGDVLTAKALEVIAGQASAPEPLFLWLSYTAPHGGGPDPSPQPPFDCDPGAKPASRHAAAFDAEPLPQPPNFNEADVSDKPPSIRNSPLLDAAAIEVLERRYRCSLESLLSVDEGVGDVVAALRASGELDNTLIVFTSDNGFFYGEHRDAQGKGKHYEPSTRVPLLIRGLDVPAGVVSNELVINADLAPTILDAADVAPPVTPDGLSLLPLLSGAQWQREELLLENRTYAAVRNDRYVYVEHTGGQDAGEIELYDLAADPYELQNLHGEPAYAGAEAQLADRLSALRVCAGGTCSQPPDITAPTVTSVLPAENATGAALSANVSVTFSEAMDKPSAEAAFSLARSAASAPPVSGAFSWNGNVMTFDPAAPLARGAQYTARVTIAARDLAQNPLSAEKAWNFSALDSRTGSPDAATIQVGSYRAGSAGNLGANDNLYYEVDSTTSGTRTSSWYGSFTAVPNRLSGLKVTYRGKNSRSCTQRLHIKRWNDGGAWVQLDSRTVGSTEVLVEALPGGSAADYVKGPSGDGEVQLRIRCSASTSFYARGDLMRIGYNVP